MARVLIERPVLLMWNTPHKQDQFEEDYSFAQVSFRMPRRRTGQGVLWNFNPPKLMNSYVESFITFWKELNIECWGYRFSNHVQTWTARVLIERPVSHKQTSLKRTKVSSKLFLECRKCNNFHVWWELSTKLLFYYYNSIRKNILAGSKLFSRYDHKFKLTFRFSSLGFCDQVFGWEFTNQILNALKWFLLNFWQTRYKDTLQAIPIYFFHLLWGYFYWTLHLCKIGSIICTNNFELVTRSYIIWPKRTFSHTPYLQMKQNFNYCTFYSY